MRKKGMKQPKLLPLLKCMALWGVVFTVLMTLPSVSVAQMTVSVTSFVSTQSGFVKVESDFKSLFNGVAASIQRTEYMVDVKGYGGGPVAVGTEFETGKNSEIAVAELTILKQGFVQPEKLPTLRALEKIGVGYQSGSDSFGAAGGSEISVTQTMHSTSTSTVGGTLAYLMKSEGVGEAKAGVVGEFDRECTECKKDYKAGINDTRLQSLTVPQMTENIQKLKAGFQISETHVAVCGPYEALFQGVITVPKK